MQERDRLLSAARFRQVGELLLHHSSSECVCRHTGTRIDSSDNSELPMRASMVMQERDRLLSAACFWQVGELLLVTLRASGY